MICIIVFTLGIALIATMTLRAEGLYDSASLNYFLPQKRRVTLQFMYFGLHFYYSSIDIIVSESQPKPHLFTSKQLDAFDTGKRFIRQIKQDVQTLRESNTGGESMEWKTGGYFRLLQGTDDVYVYRHPSHASCSKVKFSHIEPQLAFESETEHKLLEREIAVCACEHTDHYRLQPFFLDNCRLIDYYNLQTDDNATQLSTELRAIDTAIENGEEIRDSEFIRPIGLVNNWDENDWTKRLHIGIKKTFKMDATCGAEKTAFNQILQFLKVGSFLDKECFIFRGLPDIIIRKNTIVASASATASVSDDCTDSSGEEATVENSWQRPTHKGCDDYSPAEKLGELVSGLHILLVAKIMRKVHKKKLFHRKFQVKGVMLDKATQTVMCTLSVDLTQNGAPLCIKLTDYMGTLDSKSLCYLIRPLTT